MNKHKFIFPMRIGLILCALCCSLAAFAQGSVSLRVVAPGGGTEIAVGEKFYIYYTLKNVEGDVPAPKQAPGGASMLAFNFSSSSSQISTVNGRTTQSFQNTYVLYARANKPGSYTFGPVTIGGVKSNSVSYNIVAERKGAQNNQAAQNQADPSAASSRQSGSPTTPQFIGKGDEHIFLKATANRTTAYEQEAIEYTVKLYTTYSRIKFIGATDAPKFDGFVVEESNDISHSLVAETYNGRQYATAVIARYVIFPQMAGKLKVIGNTYTVSADRSEIYNLGFWGNVTSYEPVQLNVTPNDLVIDVKSLPTPRPANFSGGVGEFTISSEYDNPRLLTNTAAGIKYVVSGQGNLKYISLPDLNNLYPRQLEVFSPTTDVKAKVGRTNVSGTVTFDYSFMPLEEGSFTIPEVELCYFNPKTGRYETSSARGYSVTVGKGKESEKSQTRLKGSFSTELMTDSYNIRSVHRPVVLSFWYWLFYIIPVAALATAAVVYRRYIRALSDVAGMKSKRAGKMARRRLRAADRCLKAGDEKQFYAELLKALWGYLGDKLKMPTSELSRENVAGVLSRKGIAEDIVTSVIAVIDECEFARYSPEGGADGMRQSYERGVDVIGRLENSFSELKKKPSDESASGSDRKLQ